MSMKNRKRWRAVGVIVSVALLSTFACDNGVNPSEQTQGGSLRIVVATVSGMNLGPDIDMEPHSYTIRGSGPHDEVFEVQTAQGETRVVGLTQGTWTVGVEASNNSGVLVGEGLGTVTVNRDSEQQLPIVVRPLAGPGTLELDVSWQSSELNEPAVAANLIGYDRSNVELPFLVANDRAEFSDNQIRAGYYTLALQLNDGDSVVAGAVTTVRIAEGARTEGSFRFVDVNSPAGELELVITPDLDEPLRPTISGAPEQVDPGQSFTAQAAVGNAGTAEVFFLWYLDGTAVGSGNTLQLGDQLSAGNYRLDLVSYTGDGRRAGSVSHNFLVREIATTPNPPEPVYDFIDTFDSGSIDTSVWQVATWVEHDGQTSWDRTYIEDGKLNLVFVYDPEYFAETGRYKSAAIQTRRNDFGYGRWEARLKPSDVPGVLNSMYTIDWRDSGNMTRQEVDIEFLTYTFDETSGEVWFAVHARGLQSRGLSVPLNFDPSADFHVWGFDISPERIQWFVDDQVLYTYRYADEAITIDAPYALKFNVWTKSAWINGPPAPNVETVYQIDWVRFTPYTP